MHRLRSIAIRGTLVMLFACRDSGPCLTEGAVRGADGLCGCPGGSSLVENGAGAGKCIGDAADAGGASATGSTGPSNPVREAGSPQDGAALDADAGLPSTLGGVDSGPDGPQGVNTGPEAPHSDGGAPASQSDAAVACVPMIEVCDERDNDCDQAIDEDGVCGRTADCAAPGTCALWPMPDSTGGASNKPAYVIASDVVTDQITKLSWQRNPPLQHLQPPCLALNAQCTWQQAKDYCTGLMLGGADDWRVPTPIELESILDFGVSPTFAANGNSLGAMMWDATAFSGAATAYWSSSLSKEDASLAWFVDFASGEALMRSTKYTSKDANDISPYSALVRCVRSGVDASQMVPRYTAEAPGQTVKDNWTGLTWEQRISAEATYDDSNKRCALLGTGWRIPKIKELFTLVDPTLAKPAIAPIFGPTPSGSFWSSTNSSVRDDGRAVQAPARVFVVITFAGDNIDLGGPENYAVTGGGSSTVASADTSHFSRCVK